MIWMRVSDFENDISSCHLGLDFKLVFIYLKTDMQNNGLRTYFPWVK
jgi:hypothetical protein